MSDGDPYDADSDVGRYLNFPSPEGHPYGSSEPADGTLGSHFQYAPPPTTEQAFPAAPAHTLPAPATVTHGQPPPDSGVQLPATGIYGQPAPDFGLQLPATGIHGHPAPPQTQNVAASEAPAFDGAEHYEMAPPINNNAGQYEAPAINAYDHHMAGMDVEPRYVEMAMDVQPTHMLNPEMQQGYGFPDQTTLGQGDGVHGEHYQYQAPIMDAYHYVARPPINGEPYHQAQIMNAQHHQVPAMDNIGQYEAMAVDVQQPAHTVAPETQQAYGVPEPTPMQGVAGVVDAVHYEAPPPINAHQHYEAPAFNDEHHQVQVMAMDVVQPPTQAPPPEEQMPQQQGDGAPWLEGESMFPPPSPTMCRMLDELAAMIESEATDGAEGDAGEATDGAEGDAGADAEAAAPAPEDNVGPADEEVTFKPLITGRPDCSRCRSVREVLALDGT
jgi:hypothetical protein